MPRLGMSRVLRFALLAISLVILTGLAVLVWADPFCPFWLRWLACAGLGFAMRECWKALR